MEEEFYKEPVKERAKAWMKVVKPAFAVAYFLGEADKKLDLRPGSVDDPFGKDASGRPEDFVPGPRVLIGGFDVAGMKHYLDVANLIARVRQRARVPRDKLLTLMEGVVQPEVVSPIMECFDPHHVVICYNESGEPCGGVEVCLSCNACRFDPGSDMLTKMCDTMKIARVLAEVGLPLDDKKNVHRRLRETDRRGHSGAGKITGGMEAQGAARKEVVQLRRNWRPPGFPGPAQLA